ncbi:hypothetical protein [Tsuneonella rigui]|uniref:hypothetical protein n=1 Tax=Tsuneonella rigui TaxID=1708790 RepID=UPI000F7DF6EA|nr:hypothetical protein [Tsuneonella rigui]
MTPEKRAHMIMMAAYCGTIGTALLALSLALHLPDFVRGVGPGLLVGSIFILLWRSLRDEYFEGLWAAGASWSFIAMIAWSTLVPMYLGTFEGDRASTWVPDLSSNWTLIVALGAFFAGFHAKRLRWAA